MPQFKTDVDILKYAIGREMTSYDLYDQLTERAHENDLRKMLEYLARQELEHKARLELELMKLGQIVSETETLLRLEDTAVFAALKDIDSEDIKAILEVAMEREDLSLRIYISLAIESDSDPLRETLIAIAKEEAKHHAQLQLEHDMLVSFHRSTDD